MHTVQIDPDSSLVISTRSDRDAFWDTPRLELRLQNDTGVAVRMVFLDPAALKLLAGAIRTLQHDYRALEQLPPALRRNVPPTQSGRPAPLSFGL